MYYKRYNTLKELPCSLSSVHLQHLSPLFHACYIMCHYHKKLQMRKLTHGDFLGKNSSEIIYGLLVLKLHYRTTM